MKRANLGLFALSLLGGSTLIVPANAAPPTVTPSPGYDARLQEQRRAWGMHHRPVLPVATPPSRGYASRRSPLAHDAVLLPINLRKKTRWENSSARTS